MNPYFFYCEMLSLKIKLKKDISRVKWKWPLKGGGVMFGSIVGFLKKPF